MIRRGSIEDLELVFSIQWEASIAGFASVFPPDRYPYPDEAVRRALREQLEDPANVVLVDDERRGFALVGHGWLERLFVREHAWGTGVAEELHAAALETLRAQGANSASLWCLAENARARRFYEKHGWRLNGSERIVPFPPHPFDVGYSIELVNLPEALETERLLLERWAERHRDPWRLICRDPEVMRFIGRAQLWETTKADEVFEGMLAHWREHGFGWRSVLDKAGREWLGFVGLNVLGSGVEGVAPEEIEIGWWLLRSAWGRGYASEAASAARDEGFERVRLARMIARLQPANRASSRVAEKIGMRITSEATGRHGEPLHIYCLDRAVWERRLRID